MKEFVVYNCKDILIGFGSFSLTGYADDAFLTIEDMAEEAAPTSGCDSAVVTSLDPESLFQSDDYQSVRREGKQNFK